MAPLKGGEYWNQWHDRPSIVFLQQTYLQTGLEKYQDKNSLASKPVSHQILWVLWNAMFTYMNIILIMQIINYKNYCTLFLLVRDNNFNLMQYLCITTVLEFCFYSCLKKRKVLWTYIGIKQSFETFTVWHRILSKMNLWYDPVDGSSYILL